MINAQQNIFIEVDLLFVMARIATLNWEIPIGIPGLVYFWGVFRNHGHMAAFLGV
jgi:hypothetical protein